MKKISIIIPVYNEAENIPFIAKAILKNIDFHNYNVEIIFINDGSTDNSLEILKQLSKENSAIFYLSFSKNFGHQNALKAGIDNAHGDAVISMDGDMQHPPELLQTLINYWDKEDYKIVYTIRKDLKHLSIGKRKTSAWFYNFLNKLSDIDLEQGTADYRLIDKQVANQFKEIKEYDLFWRGIVKWYGFKQIGIPYEPAERLYGSSKYTYKKMIQLALKGITSFSVKPLYLAIYTGFFFVLASLLYFPYVLISYFNGWTVSGWVSILITIVFFGGLNLLILGIVGIYIGKLFIQSKVRPHYIVEETNITNEK